MRQINSCLSFLQTGTILIFISFYSFSSVAREGTKPTVFFASQGRDMGIIRAGILETDEKAFLEESHSFGILLSVFNDSGKWIPVASGPNWVSKSDKKEDYVLGEHDLVVWVGGARPSGDAIEGLIKFFKLENHPKRLIIVNSESQYWTTSHEGTHHTSPGGKTSLSLHGIYVKYNPSVQMEFASSIGLAKYLSTRVRELQNADSNSPGVTEREPKGHATTQSEKALENELVNSAREWGEDTLRAFIEGFPHERNIERQKLLISLLRELSSIKETSALEHLLSFLRATKKDNTCHP